VECRASVEGRLPAPRAFAGLHNHHSIVQQHDPFRGTSAPWASSCFMVGLIAVPRRSV